jgi:hypothetical protein
MKRLGIVFGGLIAMLVWASAALAQSPAGEGYGGVAGQAQGGVSGSGGALPFTGFDLMLFFGGGALLLLLGLGLRHVGRAR